MRIRHVSWASMLPTQDTTTHATHKASMCPHCESCFKCAKHTKNVSEQTQKIPEAPSQFQLTTEHYLILNEIRDDDRIMQIATEGGDSCGDRRHAILLTAHSTFTQQRQYTDNMATLNKGNFPYSPQDTTPRVGCLLGRHLTKKFQGCYHPSGDAVVPFPLFLTLHSSAVSRSPVHAINKNMPQQSYHGR